MTVSFEDFDPNNVDTRQPLWGVYTHSLKTYTSRGPALNAVLSNHRAKLYEYGNGWILRAVKDNLRLPMTCSHCGLSTLEYERHYDYRTHSYHELRDRPKVNEGVWRWHRERGRITSPPVLDYLCRTCNAL